MTANIHGKMAYSFEKPMWHNITEPCLDPLTAEEVLDEKFGGGFSIFLRPVTVTLNSEPVETGDFAIVRGVSPYDNQEMVFGYCSERYKPLQPREVAQTFDNSVIQNAETMAFLGDGQEMFISWKMPPCKVREGDEVELYGIVRSGFDTMKGTRLFTSVFRPVCSNTITLAENWAKNNTDGHGRGQVWKSKGVNKNLLRDLGYWMNHVQDSAIREANLLEAFFGKLANTPIDSDDEAKYILETAYPDGEFVPDFYPKELRPQKEQTTLEFNKKQENIRNGIFRLFAGEGTEISPDYWGMMNSTSEFFCHVLPSKKPIAESVMFGNRQQETMRMVKTLSDLSG